MMMGVGLHRLAAVYAGAMLMAGAAQAQVVVDDRPVHAPAVITDLAQDALAQVNDTANATAEARKIALYRQLMELNGTSRNIRTIMLNTKAAVRLVILDRAKATSLSAAQEHKLDQISDDILKETEFSLINAVALSQAKAFSEDEITLLIKANGSEAGMRYNAGKFMAPEASAQQIQTYMVDAVVKIIKTFKEQVQS
jgi:hypothetical protein